MYDTFVSGSKRARDSAHDFGREVSSTADEVRDLASSKVDDIFSTARRGAERFRDIVGHAESEVRGLSDARIHIQARDEVSPALDGIHSKLATIAATAGGIVIGGGIKDAMFGGVTDYTREASRTAAYLSAAERQQALSKADSLYVKGFFESRSEGAKQVADIAPVIRDRSQIGDFVETSAKMKYITPDASWEEINRSLGQTTNTFNETPKQAADSMMYAYKQVGDRQRDLYDTFWEYSGYFKKTGVSSAQMSNFLVKSVQEGSFNYDKPADFFKETFGVKALDAGDMAKYFELRGSSKDVAEKQAALFTSEINSGDEQRAKGALMALVGDLSSQKPDELKASLVAMGSATAEDNGDAILRTYKSAFDKPPSEIAGTMDRMVAAQKSADPMQQMIETRRQMDLLMQGIGQSMAVDMLPVMSEFNQLLITNKDEIKSLFSGLTGLITGATGFYKEHFTVVNGFVIGLIGLLAAKKLVDFVKGAYNFARGGFDVGKNVLSTVGQGVGKTKRWITGPKNDDIVPDKKRFALRGGRDADSLRSISSMTIHAARVYVNGQISGADRGGRGRNARDELDRRRRNNDDMGPSRRTRTLPRDKAKDILDTHRPPKTEPKTGVWGKVKDSSLFTRAPGLAKGAGIVGAIAGAGVGAYSLYQASKEGGWRQAISSGGGSVVGGVAGGAIGGAIGSLVGPIGTMAGAAAGNYLGEKIGSLADTSGLTKKAVDAVASLKDELWSWKDKALNFVSGKKEEPAANIASKPLPSFTLPTFTPQAKQKMEEAFTSFRNAAKQKGIEMDFSGVQRSAKKVGDTFSTIKENVTGWWKGSNARKAQTDMHAVGAATQKAKEQAKNMGVASTKSTQDIVAGSRKAGQSYKVISAAAASTVSQVKSRLESLRNISSQGSSWGSNLMTMLIAGIRSKFPALSTAVSGAAGIIKNFLGFSSPTKEGPASKSDKWAGNFISMFASGLHHDPVKQRMNLIAGTMNRPIRGRASVDMMHRSQATISSIPLAQTLHQAPRMAGNVSIQNITMDFGEMAKQVTDFSAFAQMMTSPQGRALIRKVFGEELYNALENGG
ncbi:tail tape measure protein [Aneurinibacillus sp. BA2021]|nr:tail tape measure protein [Aneurinibacillus sp. BA2021]